ncbi:MAG TPA: DNA translocase FtsK 4TM domain-containing protein [Gaiellaceae bacterium]|nr:DNA translocase FtsK 4TM domain-containing protein [Gaiellaceae bacterium]
MARKKRPRKLRPRTPARIRRKRAPARKSQAQRPVASHHYPELAGLALLAFGVFFGAVLWGSWNGGSAGAWLANGLRDLIGAAAYVAPVALVAVGGLMLARSKLVDFRPFRIGLVLTTLGLGLALGRAHGGYFGRGLDDSLGHAIGSTGLAVLGAFTLLAGVLLLTGASVGAILRRSHQAVRVAGRSARQRLERPQTVSEEPAFEPELASAGPPPPLVDVVEDYPDLVSSEENAYEPAPLLVDLAATDGPADDTQASLFDVAETPPPDYQLPDRTILRRSKAVDGSSAEHGARTAELLVRTLSHFGVEATVSGQISGPRVTRYELQLAAGTKVSKVAGLKDDLSYALATTEIRILAPIPGKQAVGVEVPNTTPNLVTLGDVFDDLPTAASPLSVWLGKDIAGNAVWTDLARMPHLLIAGTTGSGKSGCLNTMLTSILLRATPDEVRMIMIDPKRIELGFYESIPHLLTSVVSSPKQAAAALINVVGEMERRYERMSLMRARGLPELNRALRARGIETLPYLLVVIDELADLMMISPQEVEDAIIRLAQKSRAVGIHLVLATQRPSVDVITGMIKANVPSRIAFAVSSQTDSRVILDQSGAESLLGQGDMLFKPLGTSRLQRLQGAYISEEEIALVVEQCRAQRPQELDESLLVAPETEPDESDEGDGEFDPDEDPLLEKAIEIVVQTQTASVSLIQRRLRVGYTRAGRLIDMLERRGIISGYEGSKPRRVLVGEHELDRS